MLNLLKGVCMEKNFDFWLTTEDNPWNPFTQFESWNDFDVKKRYMTCSRLADRTGLSVDNLTDYENEVLTNLAIEDIVDHDFVVDPDSGKVVHYRICTTENTVNW